MQTPLGKPWRTEIACLASLSWHTQEMKDSFTAAIMSATLALAGLTTTTFQSKKS